MMRVLRQNEISLFCFNDFQQYHDDDKVSEIDSNIILLINSIVINDLSIRCACYLFNITLYLPSVGYFLSLPKISFHIKSFLISLHSIYLGCFIFHRLNNSPSFGSYLLSLCLATLPSLSPSLPQKVASRE